MTFGTSVSDIIILKYFFSNTHVIVIDRACMTILQVFNTMFITSKLSVLEIVSILPKCNTNYFLYSVAILFLQDSYNPSSTIVSIINPSLVHLQYG